MESDFVNQFKAEHSIQIKLKNYDPDFTDEINKDYAENVLENDLVNRLSNLQVQTLRRQKPIYTDNSTRSGCIRKRRYNKKCNESL